MRFYYRLAEDSGGWIAECDQMDAIGRGDTPIDAVLELRRVLAERIDRPYAVAPPEEMASSIIDLVPLDDVFTSVLDEEELSTS